MFEVSCIVNLGLYIFKPIGVSNFPMMVTKLNLPTVISLVINYSDVQLIINGYYI